MVFFTSGSDFRDVYITAVQIVLELFYLVQHLFNILLPQKNFIGYFSIPSFESHLIITRIIWYEI